MRQRNELGLFLNDLNLCGTGVEVGVFRGEFAYEILTRWRGQKLMLVDPWKHEDDYFDSWNLPDSEMQKNYEITVGRLSSFANRVELLRMRSEEAVHHVPDNSCDFVYIDGNHAYKAIKTDLRVWYPKVRAGGLVCGHDYYDAVADAALEPIRMACDQKLSAELLTSYGVKTAVCEFTELFGYKVMVTDDENPSWYFRKTC